MQVPRMCPLAYSLWAFDTLQYLARFLRSILGINTVSLFRPF